MTHHLVGLTEIGKLLGVSRQRASQIVVSYDDFPDPEIELAAGRIWSRTAVEAWVRAHPQRPTGRQEKEKPVKGRGLFEDFTEPAKQVIVLAQEQARLLNHKYIGTEHLLLGLVAEPNGVAGRVLRAQDVTVDAVRARVEEMIGAGTQTPEGHLPFTPRAKKTIELGVAQARDLEHGHVGTEHVLLGLIAEGLESVTWIDKERGTAPAGVAPRVLVDLGLRLDELRDAVLLAAKTGDPEPSAPPDPLFRVATYLKSMDDRLRAIEAKLAEGS